MRSLLVLAALLVAVRVIGTAILIGAAPPARRRTSPTVDPCLGPFITTPVRRSPSPEGRLAALLIAGAIRPATYRESMTRLAARDTVTCRADLSAEGSAAPTPDGGGS